MSSHHGQTIERIIRKGRYSLSQVARLMNVHRRIIYHWFTHPLLNPASIHKLGHVINHDFSTEFPELFVPADFIFKNKPYLAEEKYNELRSSDDESYWKEKYLDLDKRYAKLQEEMFKSKKTG
jgi:hypothetical protein